MSIQGSVNQLLSEAGRFAQMYGIVNPTIGERIKVKSDIKAIEKAEKQENLSKEDETKIKNAKENVQKRIDSSPYLSLDKTLNRLNLGAKDIAKYNSRNAQLDIDAPYINLSTEGMQKVQQNANYAQRRKDKGDI